MDVRVLIRGLSRGLSRGLMLAVALGLSLSPAAAQRPNDVDVELVLLADASNSIDEAEIRFQRSGYATALTHRDVLSAIAKGDLGRIAVTFIEWADAVSQDVVVPWMIIRDRATAQAFIDRLMRAPRRAYGSNAIGEAIAAAHKAIESNAYHGHRKIIDLSGDSANNWNGQPIETARRKALAAGIVINGLAILCRLDDCGGRPVSYDLGKAFSETIIGGPGSFVITVDTARAFTDTVRRKLILELAELAPAGNAHTHR